MNSLPRYFILFLVLFISGHNLWSQVVNTMSFNLRYDNTWDKENSWSYRKPDVVKLIKHYEASIIGIQEGLESQVKFLADSLTNFSYVGVGRDDGKKKGEFAAIFYDTLKFAVIKSGTFWLSQKPDTVSVGWDAALERICTYALFISKSTSKKFWVFNTHFDHVGVVAREQSATLILEKIKEFNDKQFPVILMGDFNSTPESQQINLIKSYLSDAKDISQKPLYGPIGTFNAFVSTDSVFDCIDFIFVKEFEVLSVTHIDDKRNNNRCISDHYPVFAILRLGERNK